MFCKINTNQTGSTILRKGISLRTLHMRITKLEQECSHIIPINEI